MVVQSLKLPMRQHEVIGEIYSEKRCKVIKGVELASARLSYLKTNCAKALSKQSRAAHAEPTTSKN